MQIFARITKVDEATGKVYGRAVQEVVDRSGEIFDYETSKPNFAKWSEAAAQATDGKSVGNLRAMHGKVAAGKLTEITFQDAEKAIDIVAEVVDPVEREKCLKGVYTGFSIGGRYAKRWEDGVEKGVSRYTAEPTEISLVDLPCVPTAQFTVVKADGAEELRKFETTADNAEALAKWVEGLTEAERAAVLAKLAPAASADSDKPDAAAKDYSAQAERLAKNANAAPLAAAIATLIGYQPQLEKGLWAVADFAQVLQSLAGITDCAADEAAWEKDGSKVPAQLRAALKPLADAFLAMAAEEVNEAIKPEVDEAVVIELAAGNEGLAKMLGTNNADAHRELDEMEKETDPDDQESLDHLDDARDALEDSDDVAKGDFPGHPFRGNQYTGGSGGGARHRSSRRAHEASKQTRGKNSTRASHEAASAAHARAARSHARAGADKQAAYHEHMAAYHASRANRFKKSDDGDLAKAADALQKVTTERDDALAKLAAITKQHADWLTQRADPKGTAKVVAVEKTLSTDAGDPPAVDDSPVLKAGGTVDHQATALKLMKVAYRKPMTVR